MGTASPALMIDLTIPPVGQQPRDLVVEVISDVFDQALALADTCAEPPQLGPALDEAVGLARAAQGRDDVIDLDQQLQHVAVAAIASVVRIRAALDPRSET
jgi:hypothetical protein